MAMTTSTKGKLEIISHEAIVLCPYRDSVGVWTWGIGHTAGAGMPHPADMPKGVASTIADVFATFATDIAKYEARVRKAFTKPISQAQFDAAVSFDLNTGEIHRASWVREFNAGNIGAARADFMIWRIPASIIDRRKAECTLFFDGKYSNNGYATVYTADASGRVLWSKGKRTYVASLLAGTEKAAAAPPSPVPPLTSNSPTAPQASPPASIPAVEAPSPPASPPPVPAPAPAVAGPVTFLALGAMAVAGWWHHLTTWLHSLF